MDASESMPPEAPEGRSAGDRLGSWKSIATYLGHDVSTVQRWERHEGMPVHRHVHLKRGSVYASRAELDAWRTSRGAAFGPVSVTSREPDTRHSLRRRSALVWLSLATAALAIVIGTWLRGRNEDVTQSLLLDAHFSPLTDFEGMEREAAISRDGKFVAFLSDRTGTLDAWVGQIGTGEYHNLTQGRVAELQVPGIRSLGFSPDGTLVTLWTRRPGDNGGPAVVSTWAAPTMGGTLRPLLDSAAEIAWSNDGSRLAYHTTEPGDPVYVVPVTGVASKPVYVAPRDQHCHFPVWSPDDAWLYFARGLPAVHTNLWRIRPDGSGAQQMTFHEGYVSHPAFIDRNTLLYLATSGDGSGPWLYALDVDSHASHRVQVGVGRYTSLATSADGRRLVVTLANPRASLWRASLADGSGETSVAERIALPSGGGRSPRLGPGYLIYVVGRGDHDGLWKLSDGSAVELWSAPRARIVGGAAIAPDGRSVAFTVEQAGRDALKLIAADGTRVRELAAALDVAGSPDWAPDGRSMTVAARVDGAPRLFRVALDGSPPVPLVTHYSTDPSWSPDGRFVVYSGAEVGPTFTVDAVTAGGQPFKLPDLTLPRGARRVRVLPDGSTLLALHGGGVGSGDFVAIDLVSGKFRKVTDFGHEFTVGDFDVSADGREIVFDRVAENSDIVLIER